jgi:PAS domain S-box-containing protein
MFNQAFADSRGLDSSAVPKDIDEVAELVEGLNLADKFWDAVERGVTIEVEEDLKVKRVGTIPARLCFRPVVLPTCMSWCVFYLERARIGSEGSRHISEYQSYVARLVTASADAIVGLDPNGIVRYWNQGAQALFGYTEDEILGKPVASMVPEELRREAQLVLKVVKEKGSYKNYDTFRLGKGGKRIPVTMTISSVRGDNGEFMGSVAIIKDTRSAKDLHEKALEAEKLNAALQVAVSVYHRINDPLCVITANAQLLLARLGGSDGDEARRLKSMLEATRRISQVLEDLNRLTGGVEPAILPPEFRK